MALVDEKPTGKPGPFIRLPKQPKRTPMFAHLSLCIQMKVGRLDCGSAETVGAGERYEQAMRSRDSGEGPQLSRAEGASAAASEGNKRSQTGGLAAFLCLVDVGRKAKV